MKETVDSALAETEGVSCRINMALERHQDGEFSFDQLLEEGMELLEQGERAFLDAAIDREALCTLLFTSGTTGTCQRRHALSQEYFGKCL